MMVRYFSTIFFMFWLFPELILAAGSGSGFSAWIDGTALELADTDLIGFTDVSDTTQSSSGSSKKATMLQVKNYVLANADNTVVTFPICASSAGGTTTWSLCSTGLDALETPRYNAGGTAWEYVKLRAIADEREPVCWFITASDTATAVADGKQAFVVPASMNGMLLVDVTCSVHDLNSAASGATTVVLRRVRGATAVDMTSTGVTINYDEYTASDETVDTSNDDLATGDKIYVDVNAVTSAAQKGLSCTALFANP